MKIRLGLCAALALAAAAPARAADRDPFTGVWTYDPAQSTASSDYTQRLTITVRGDEETYFSEVAGKTGSRSLLSLRVRYDGAPVATHTFNIAPDGTITAVPMEVVARSVDTTHRIVEHRVNGRVVRVLKRAPMDGGRALVSELTDFDAEGRQTRSSRLVFVATPPKF
ncbi:hypothetical protein [Phenylobacterium sp.]|jgi:hypothetical protein|uniref:hypothetical protein n=1 Tax=Phenylobacterium sp. TaxID=1871053 RepID=UPI0037831676